MTSFRRLHEAGHHDSWTKWSSMSWEIWIEREWRLALPKLQIEEAISFIPSLQLSAFSAKSGYTVMLSFLRFVSCPTSRTKLIDCTKIFIFPSTCNARMSPISSGNLADFWISRWTNRGSRTIVVGILILPRTFKFSVSRYCSSDIFCRSSIISTVSFRFRYFK